MTRVKLKKRTTNSALVKLWILL